MILVYESATVRRTKFTKLLIRTLNAMENKQTNAFALGLENIVCTTRDNNRNNKVCFSPSLSIPSHDWHKFDFLFSRFSLNLTYFDNAFAIFTHYDAVVVACLFSALNATNHVAYAWMHCRIIDNKQNSNDSSTIWNHHKSMHFGRKANNILIVRQKCSFESLFDVVVLKIVRRLGNQIEIVITLFLNAWGIR